MNSVASVTTLNTYRLGEGKDVLNGAINVDAQYDKQSAQYVSRLETVYGSSFLDLSTEISFVRHGQGLTCFSELRYIIENYRELNRGGDFWKSFHPDTCTWYHVHDELNKVEEEYKRKGRIFRRALREDGLTRNLTPLLEGIPENDGLGFLKGGLRIVFNVCSTFSCLSCTITHN